MLAIFFWQRPRGTRLFHQLAIVILATSSLAYFSMASDLGATPISAEFRADGATRQIWVRTLFLSVHTLGSDIFFFLFGST